MTLLTGTHTAVFHDVVESTIGIAGRDARIHASRSYSH